MRLSGNKNCQRAEDIYLENSRYPLEFLWFELTEPSCALYLQFCLEILFKLIFVNVNLSLNLIKVECLQFSSLRHCL